MDKLQLTGLNLGRVFNSRGGHVYAMHSCSYLSKLPNLKLKTRPKQLLGSLPLDIELPGRGLYLCKASAVLYGWESLCPIPKLQMKC
jgi:hypothetical protein